MARTQQLALLAIHTFVGSLAVPLALADVPQGRFVNPQPVRGVNTDAREFSPVISKNGLELYFDSDRGGSSDIWVATRSSRHSDFENVAQVSGVNSSSDDDPGSISSNGLTLYFASNRSGNFDMYQATRSDLGQPFGSVRSLGPGVNTSIIENVPFVSQDGSKLYYHRTAADLPTVQQRLWMATREDPTQDLFDEATDLGDAVNGTMNDSWKPTVSSDELTLFLSDLTEVGTGDPRPGGLGGSDIWVAHRESTGDAFGMPVNLNELWPGSTVNSSAGETLAHISPEWPAFGSRLYFTTNRGGDMGGDIWEATWVPEPSTSAVAGVGLLAVLGNAGRARRSRVRRRAGAIRVADRHHDRRLDGVKTTTIAAIMFLTLRWCDPRHRIHKNP